MDVFVIFVIKGRQWAKNAVSHSISKG
jgi:hypothetical protein